MAPPRRSGGIRPGVAILAGAILLGLLLWTSYHQQHRLSRALHAAQHEHGKDEGGLPSSAGGGSGGGAGGASAVDWHAVWAAARAAGSEGEFQAAMASSGFEGGSRRSAISEGASANTTAAPATAATAAACPVCTAAPATPCPTTTTPAPAVTQAAAPANCTSAAAAANASAAAAAAAAPAWQAFVTDGQPPPLSVGLARAVAGEGAVIVTWANYALWDFVQTWVYHAKQVGLSNFLVGAMDAQIGAALVGGGVPCFAMYDRGANHSGVGSDHLQWGGEAFHKMGRQKINLAQLFLGLGLDLLLVDVDVVLLGDVMEYFGRYPQADILVTSDQLASSLEAGDDGLELPDRAQSPMNIGLMFFRYSERTVKFVDSWLAAINADPQYWDQNAFNDLARRAWDPVNLVHPHQKRVFMGANGTIAVGVLPVASFSGGHTFYVQRLYEVQRVKPYAVHCTFQYGANPGKRNRLREAALFHDPPEYWTDDAYISVELRRVPSATWAEHSARNNSAMKRYHFRGLDMQLASVWPAIRLAAVFNRSVIVPPLACYCDKYWTELDQCRVPGARQTRIPFLCPMDHVLDPIFMNDAASKHVVRWREHSFLANPRCPDWVKRSKVTFYVGKADSKVVEKMVIQEGGLVVMLPANLTEGALREALKPYSQYKHWHLKDPETVFGGFDDAALGEEVEKRIRHLQPHMPPDPSPPPPPAVANATAPAAAAAAGAGAGAGAAGNATAAGAGVASGGGVVVAGGGQEGKGNAGMLAAVHERRSRQ